MMEPGFKPKESGSNRFAIIVIDNTVLIKIIITVCLWSISMCLALCYFIWHLSFWESSQKPYKYYHYLHVTDERSKASNGWVTSSKSHGQQVEEKGFDSMPTWPQTCIWKGSGCATPRQAILRTDSCALKALEKQRRQKGLPNFPFPTWHPPGIKCPLNRKGKSIFSPETRHWHDSDLYKYTC